MNIQRHENGCIENHSPKEDDSSGTASPQAVAPADNILSCHSLPTPDSDCREGKLPSAITCGGATSSACRWAEPLNAGQHKAMERNWDFLSGPQFVLKLV
jgi:hypothetical protein